MDPLVATFPAGMTSSGNLACVDITILDDMALEGQHGFVVQITDVCPDEANIISPSIAAVIIGDNDGEFVYTQWMIRNQRQCYSSLTYACLCL